MRLLLAHSCIVSATDVVSRCSLVPRGPNSSGVEKGDGDKRVYSVLTVPYGAARRRIRHRAVPCPCRAGSDVKERTFGVSVTVANDSATLCRFAKCDKTVVRSTSDNGRILRFVRTNSFNRAPTIIPPPCVVAGSF